MCDTCTSYEWTWLYPLPTSLATQSRAKSKNIYNSGPLSLIFKIKLVVNAVVSRVKFFSLKVTKMPALLPRYQLGPLFLYFFSFFSPAITCFETACFDSQVISETRAFCLPEVLLGPECFPLHFPESIPLESLLLYWPDSKGAVHITKLAWKADIKKARAPDDSGINALHQNKLLSNKITPDTEERAFNFTQPLYWRPREPRTVWNAATSVACLRCWGMTWSQEELCCPCRHGGIHARVFRSNRRDLASQFYGLSLW